MLLEPEEKINQMQSETTPVKMEPEQVTVQVVPEPATGQMGPEPVANPFATEEQPTLEEMPNLVQPQEATSQSEVEEKPVESPVEQPVEQPASEEMPNPVQPQEATSQSEVEEKPVESSVEQPVEQPTSEEMPKPVQPQEEASQSEVEEQPVEAPVEQPVEQPISEEMPNPVQPQEATSQSEIEEKPVESSVEQPVEQPTSEEMPKPVQPQEEASQSEVEEKPVESSAEQPVVSTSKEIKPKKNQTKTVSMILTIIIILGVGYFIFTILRSYYDSLRYNKEKEVAAKEVVEEKDVNLDSAAVVESMARIKIFNKCSGYLPTVFYKTGEVKISDLNVDEIVTMLYFSKYDACGEVMTISPDEVKSRLISIFGRDDFTILEANQNFTVTTDANQNYIITPKNCGICTGETMQSTISRATIADNTLFVYEAYNNFQYKWNLNKGSDGRYYFVSISKI